MHFTNLTLTNILFGSAQRKGKGDNSKGRHLNYAEKMHQAKLKQRFKEYIFKVEDIKYFHSIQEIEKSVIKPVELRRA